MTCLAHISDLHFGRTQAKLIDALQQCFQAIHPDLIIISGDVTQNAKHREFRQARQFLQSLEQPYFIVPGNHDISGINLPERFFQPWRKWQRYISPHKEPILHQAAFTIVGVNTVRRANLHPDWSRGHINAQQTAHLQQVFAHAKAQALRIVVAHHPFWLPQALQKRGLVGRRDQALQVLQNSDVDLVLGGHVHVAFARSLKGILVSHAGTTLSNRLMAQHPNSFNLMRGDRRHLSIEQWEWQGERFAQRHCQDFQRTVQGWQGS